MSRNIIIWNASKSFNLALLNLNAFSEHLKPIILYVVLIETGLPLIMFNSENALFIEHYYPAVWAGNCLAAPSPKIAASNMYLQLSFPFELN